MVYDYYLIEIGLVAGLLTLYVVSVIVYHILRKKIKKNMIFLGLLILVLMPLITWLTYNQVGNYWSQPTAEDSRRLGEMTAKVIHSKDYQKVAKNETVYSIVASISLFNRPDHAYLYDVYVYTDKDEYAFSCDNSPWNKEPACKEVHIGSSSGISHEYGDGHTFFKGYKGFRNGVEQ